MTGIAVEIARKRFPPVGGAPPLTVYDGFRLDVEPGSFVCLLGPSGIGKTTLLNIIAGLDRDFEGTVRFAGTPGPRVAYAFQTPRLLPWRTVLQNILLVMPDGATAAGEAAARRLLVEMGLGEAAGVYPERLSLGMQRRVALARAFAIEPDLLLMDEPFVSLDEATAERLRELLLGLLARRPATVLFVTHDSREAVRLADRLVVLDGPPAAIRSDFAVSLSAAERHDPAAIDGVREALRADVQGAGAG